MKLQYLVTVEIDDRYDEFPDCIEEIHTTIEDDAIGGVGFYLSDDEGEEQEIVPAPKITVEYCP